MTECSYTYIYIYIYMCVCTFKVFRTKNNKYMLNTVCKRSQQLKCPLTISSIIVG